jgi:hypothetical protein
VTLEAQGPQACPMEYISLGRTDLRVSRICLGMMSYGAVTSDPGRSTRRPSHVQRAVGAAPSSSIPPTSTTGAEAVIGRLLKKLFGMRSTWSRRRCTARTMPGVDGVGLSRKHVLASIDASLQRLGLDYATCTRSTAGIHGLRSRRPWRRMSSPRRQGGIGASSMAPQFARPGRGADAPGVHANPQLVAGGRGDVPSSPGVPCAVGRSRGHRQPRGGDGDGALPAPTPGDSVHWSATRSSTARPKSPPYGMCRRPGALAWLLLSRA